MAYGVYYKKEKHCLLALCDSIEGAQVWIDSFNPNIWVNKNMRKEDLEIREVKND